MSIVISGPPQEPVEIPAAVKAILQPGESAEVVWRNDLAGLTFRLSGGEAGNRFAKWAPNLAGIDRRYRGLDLAAEAERTNWAKEWVRVPKVMAFQQCADGELFVTREIPAPSAVHPLWLAQPQKAARAIGRGLRSFHDSLPVRECPYSWSVAKRVEYGGLSGTNEGNALIAAAPQTQASELVVCHGDACAPNFLIGDNGEVAGYVDLGRLGIASRWADLAVAAWSTEWNYGTGFTALVYAGYGMEPDAERIAYYRRLWGAT